MSCGDEAENGIETVVAGEAFEVCEAGVQRRENELDEAVRTRQAWNLQIIHTWKTMYFIVVVSRHYFFWRHFR